MAGHPLGATAPISSVPTSAPQSAPVRVMAASRTRRNHGVFMLGNEVASIYSSRRVADGSRVPDGLGVILSVGSGSLVLTGSMTATQARVMARVLVAAAAAAEAQGGAA